MIDLKTRKITPFSNEIRDIKRLMKTAFPQNEQFPFWLLIVLSVRASVSFLAYYDGEAFCGISYCVKCRDMVFVLYIAVNDKIRSKGYGSCILQHIKRTYADCRIALNIEPVVPEADNYEQRKKRLMFYQKNGFFDSGYNMYDGTDEYRILFCGNHFSPDDYQAVLRHFSFCLYVPEIKLAA